VSVTLIVINMQMVAGKLAYQRAMGEINRGSLNGKSIRAHPAWPATVYQI